MVTTVKGRSLFDPTIVRQAVIDSFRKLTPKRQVRNPVMFVVYVGSILTTLLWVQALVGKGEAPGCGASPTEKDPRGGNGPYFCSSNSASTTSSFFPAPGCSLPGCCAPGASPPPAALPAAL